eukprot:TRINITY_DN2459_c2_g1_i1.p1 TRINITY_DN2459_c2_g1~~TRINITY_DN2459_c2_g1_i1.p1  ORF type:complete len:670 (+),score=195.34 TRINITY_DN2459_c2_g1_i1:70-2010(+)
MAATQPVQQQPQGQQPAAGEDPPTSGRKNELSQDPARMRFAATAPPISAARLVPQQTLPQALRVHPKGFKILSRASPIERALTSYFRLPPQPTPLRRAEMGRVRRMLQLRRIRGKRPRALDGFLLLEAAGAEDPEDAIEATLTDEGLRAAVPDDLAYFTSLEFLDVGENPIPMGDLAALKALEELHMHCCGLGRVVVPKGAFQRLETLNLSFNALGTDSLDSLFELPCLVRLDLSCNDLVDLPHDLSRLENLRQLALENNRLEREQVFEALGTLPQLQEVNLNKNPLTRVPKLVESAFPRLEVVGLADCQFQYFEDLFAVTEWGRTQGTGAGLRRAVLWGNPIERRRKDLDILCYELAAFDIQVILDPPVPPQRKVGEFYTASTKTMRKVSEFRSGPLRPQPPPSPAAPQAAAAPAPAPQQQQQQQQESAAYQDSFFVTQTATVGDTPGMHMTPSVGQDTAPAAHPGSGAGPGAARPQGQQQQPAASWFQLSGHEAVDLNREIEELLMQPATPDVTEGRGGGGEGGGGGGGGGAAHVGGAGTPAQRSSRRWRPPSRPASRRGVPGGLNPPTLRAAHRLLREALAKPLTQPVSVKAARRRGPRRPTPGVYANIYASQPASGSMPGTPGAAGHHLPALPAGGSLVTSP